METDNFFSFSLIHFQFSIYIYIHTYRINIIYHLLMMKVKLVLLFAFFFICHCMKISSSNGSLVLGYYKQTCPAVENIVQRIVAISVLKDPRMAASLLRLHFHDCFVLVYFLSLSLNLLSYKLTNVKP